MNAQSMKRQLAAALAGTLALLGTGAALADPPHRHGPHGRYYYDRPWDGRYWYPRPRPWGGAIIVSPGVVMVPPPPVIYVPVPATPAPVQAVPASPVYQMQDGRYCREYQTTVTIDGRPQASYGTACLEPDGAWRIVN